MILAQRSFALIRHGETDANRDGIIAGRMEAQLTEQGRDVARALAGKPFAQPITVFTSPQARAQNTAILAFPSLKAHVVADLRERDWGIYEGSPLADLPPHTATGPSAPNTVPLLYTALADSWQEQPLFAEGTSS